MLFYDLAGSDLKMSLNKTPETSELQSTNSKDSSSRFDGTKSVVNVYSKDTPGQEKKKSKILEIVERTLKEINDIS